MSRPRVSGLVLAAGGSSRLGRPKQLLPYREATLLDHVVGMARECAFDELVVVIGGAAEDVRARVDLSGCEVVVNEGFGEGCSSSIAAALDVVRGDVLVLLLGDQPGVTEASVRALLDGRGDAELAACRYDDGRGHPLAFSRKAFDDLRALHGDKGVRRVPARGTVTDVRVPGGIPRDVETQADYEAIA